MIGKGLLWCNEKCVCQDENAKLFCRGVNERDLFIYTEFTKEIEVRKSFVGLKWHIFGLFGTFWPCHFCLRFYICSFNHRFGCCSCLVIGCLY